MTGTVGLSGGRRQMILTTAAACGAAVLALSGVAIAQNTGGPPAAGAAEAPLDWRIAERGVLAEQVQLTFDEDFAKAGEAYFSRDDRWIIFQAVPRPAEGQRPDPFYAMYVARLRYEGDRIIGADKAIQVSPPGSANTCGWFDPRDVSRIYFGSTVIPPSASEAPGFQRDGSKYKWMFPPETEIVTMIVPEIFADEHPGAPLPPPEVGELRRITGNDTYDAEGSLDPTGRFLLYTRVDAAPAFADLYIRDMKTGESNRVVTAEGYDGGPFFSPDGKRITYRSDRLGNNYLQLFVGHLKFDEHGVPVGLTQEFQLTDGDSVNWCPYWHPQGRHLVYASSAIGHFNYEVFITTADPGDLPGSNGSIRYGLLTRRVTHAPGFDGLPVFNSDGRHMMWTSQRSMEPGRRGESQLWVARFVMELDPGPAVPPESLR